MSLTTLELGFSWFQHGSGHACRGSWAALTPRPVTLVCFCFTDPAVGHRTSSESILGLTALPKQGTHLLCLPFSENLACFALNSSTWNI